MASDSDVASACMSTRMIGVSRRSSGRIASAVRNGQSIGFMKTRPMRFSTATRFGPAFTVTHPTPGVPAGKLAGRNSKFSLPMYSMISFLSQMWLPEVITSTPWSRRPRAMAGVTPKPPAAFSTLTTARSAAWSRRSRGKSLTRAARPPSPKTSPIIRMFIERSSATGMKRGWDVRGARGCVASFGDFDGARLPDDHDLDVTGVLHLVLDALADVLGQLMGVEVGDDLGARHHAQLAASLDRVAHLDALVGQRDLLELRQPLDVRLEDVPPGSGPGRRDAVGRLDEHGLDGLRLHVLVPAQGGVDDCRRLVVFGEHLQGQLRVAPL